MALKTLYITGVEGQTYVYHPELAYTEVVSVDREGKMLVETTDAPTGKYFRHLSSDGKIELDATIPIITMTPEPTPTTRFAPLPEEFVVMIKTN